MEDAHVEITTKFFRNCVVMRVPATGVAFISYFPAGLQHFGCYVHIFSKNHMIGETADFHQCFAAISGEGVGHERSLDTQFLAICQGLDSGTFWVVEGTGVLGQCIGI
ncbi:hypothetical protein D3C76_885580 [compost metagenome]